VITSAVLAFALVAGGGLAVEHEPLACVRIDTYPRVEAHGVPAADVAAAELHFRTGTGGWYRIHMTRAGETWTALLPRPTTARDAFEYRVALTPSSLGEPVVSPAVSVPVTPTCATSSASSVAASIVVTIPEGAPVVPPVPAGFSPMGVVAAESPRAGSSRKPLLLAGAGVIGAAVIVGAAASSDGPVSEPDIPTFRLFATVPVPGSPVSLTAGSLRVFLTLSHAPSPPLDFEWSIWFRRPSDGQTCVLMQDTFRGADGTGLVLTAPLTATGGCGPAPFDTSNARLIIDVGADVVQDETLEIPFRFEP
jgi:hypothetical protein